MNKINQMKITVLMSTYNGEKYLREQIDSILSQNNVNVNILVRDDGSSDSTRNILDEYEGKNQLHWYTGDNLKPANSFMNLIYNAPDSDYYAFSDQDDYWLPNKLIRAEQVLNNYNSNEPSLYYSCYTMVDEKLKPLTRSRDKQYVSLTIKQSIISSAATGCTMVFNKKLRDYLKLSLPDFQIMHDNWTHKVCVAIGGNVYHDSNSYIYYRQHGNNVIGGQTTLCKRLKRHINTVFRNPCYRSKSIRTLYKYYKDYMPETNKKICRLICNYNSGLNRFKVVFDKKFKTGNFRIDFIFRIAVLLGVF